MPLSGPESYVDIWSSLCAGDYPPLEAMLGDRAASPAERARVEKFLKGRLAAAADHFNRDSKKGFQFLQSLKLLPPQLDPPTVARFLRCCPGLAKPSIGEILGERDAFYEDVRTAFMETFDFRGELGGQAVCVCVLVSVQVYMPCLLFCVYVLLHVLHSF